MYSKSNPRKGKWCVVICFRDGVFGVTMVDWYSSKNLIPWNTQEDTGQFFLIIITHQCVSRGYPVHNRYHHFILHIKRAVNVQHTCRWACVFVIISIRFYSSAFILFCCMTLGVCCHPIYLYICQKVVIMYILAAFYYIKIITFYDCEIL